MKKLRDLWKKAGGGWLAGMLIVAVLVNISPSDSSAKEPDETYYSDLYYGNVEDDEMRQLCVELDAEGQCPFEADTNYLIRFDFPDKMREEIAAGQGTYEIKIGYDFQVAAGEHGHIAVEVRNPETKRVYTSSYSSFEAMDDLCLKHRLFMYPDGTLSLAGFAVDEDKYKAPDCLMFVLYTSASAEDGPQHTIIEDGKTSCMMNAVAE